jgi:hypothetical protein
VGYHAILSANGANSRWSIAVEWRKTGFGGAERRRSLFFAN